MDNLIEKFTLECRTNKSHKLSNRAKQVIKDVEKEISIATNID